MLNFFAWIFYSTYCTYITYSETNALFWLLVSVPSSPKRHMVAIESDDDEGQPTTPRLGKHG